MKKNQKGGIVFEYLLVSIFAFFLFSIIFTLITKAVNDRIQNIAEKVGIDIDEITFGGF